MLILPSIAVALAMQAAPPAPATCKPAFKGRIVAAFNDDGRTMTITEPYSFRDPECFDWNVPAGATVDGASIPKLFWNLIGGPFEDKYRNASVIHDWYSDRRTQPWKKVHRMFYDAMIASGVPLARAKIMYAAVYYGGPRWSDAAIQNNRLADQSVDLARADKRVIGAVKQGGSATLEAVPGRHGRDPPPGQCRAGADRMALDFISGQISTRNLSLDQIEATAEVARRVADTGCKG